MVMVFLQFDSIEVSLATRSGQGHVKKMANSKMFNFEKKRYVSDAECPQESNGAICFSVSGLEPPKNHVWLYDVTIRRHVVESNLAFGGQKSMYRLEILCCGECWLFV